MNDARRDPEASPPLAVVRDGETLALSGALTRVQVAAAWKLALPQVAGVRRIDLTRVPLVDSAGLALLAELAARAGGGVAIIGQPAGLAELGAAYRLDGSLAFANT
jgi:phospholipid transport system transporter-binding protein